MIFPVTQPISRQSMDQLKALRSRLLSAKAGSNPDRYARFLFQLRMVNDEIERRA